MVVSIKPDVDADGPVGSMATATGMIAAEQLIPHAASMDALENSGNYQECPVVLMSNCSIRHESCQRGFGGRGGSELASRWVVADNSVGMDCSGEQWSRLETSWLTLRRTASIAWC